MFLIKKTICGAKEGFGWYSVFTSNFITLFLKISVYTYWCVECEYRWVEVRGQLSGVALSFRHVGSRDWIQILRLGSQHLSWLSHLASPFLFEFIACLLLSTGPLLSLLVNVSHGESWLLLLERWALASSWGAIKTPRGANLPERCSYLRNFMESQKEKYLKLIVNPFRDSIQFINSLCHY